MPSQQVTCPNCDALIPAADINIAALIAKCSACDHVSQIPRFEQTTLLRSKPPARPSGVREHSGRGAELLIERRWFQPQLFFLLFFCVFWDGFLVFWYSMAFLGPPEQGDGFNWIMVVFPIGHVAVGVCLTYYVAAGFLNKSRVAVEHRTVRVHHGPVYWRGNREVRRAEIVGIEVDETYENNGVPQSTVSAHLADGRLVTLLSSIRGDQADYIAWRLAEQLGVEEVRRDKPQGTGGMPSWLSRWLKPSRHG